MRDFLEKLASKSPTPGGGAAAAVTGAMAAALVEMVVNLTEGLKLDTKNLRGDLLKLADEDCRAFDAVMTAYKSKVKIKEALQRAIEVPEETKRLAKEVEKLARIAVKKGNKNAISDAKTAIYLAQAAQRGAGENIKINKTLLKKLNA